MDVSIIIPTYNRLWSLPQAIESCRGTLCNTEIIVIDDGSTDLTWAWLQEQKDLIIYRQNNWGKCWAVNKGVELATGKYIRFLDSDDQLNINAIDEQFQLAEKEASDVVVSGFKLIDENNKITREQKWTICDDFIAQQLGECDSSHYSAYLFRKEYIKDIPHRPDFAYRDDRLFVLELALKKPKVSIHTGFALLHRMHFKERLQFTDGIKHINQNSQHLLIYQKTLTLLKEKDILTKRRINAATKILWPLAHWMAKTHIREANELVNWIRKLDPDFEIPDKGVISLLYQHIGFKRTEQLLRLRRFFKYRWA